MKQFLSNNDNRPLAFITMCADPIHHGHINILQKAKEYGSVVVGLMTDSAMKAYKSPPMITFEKRLEVILELKSVSYAIPIESIDFVPVLRKYKFEFFLHGDDWKDGIQAKSRDEAIKVMAEWGGLVIDVPYTKGISSSDLKRNIS